MITIIVSKPNDDEAVYSFYACGSCDCFLLSLAARLTVVDECSLKFWKGREVCTSYALADLGSMTPTGYTMGFNRVCFVVTNSYYYYYYYCSVPPATRRQAVSLHLV